MSFEKKGSKKHRRTKKDTTKSDEALESRWLM
jgi:hypothetical protein